MALMDYCSEIAFEVTKNKFKFFENKLQIKQLLENFVEHQYKKNLECTREEEIDFEELANYICTELLEGVDKYLFGQMAEREKSRNTIIRKALAHSQSNTKLAGERVRKLLESALNIVRDFCRSQISKEGCFVAAQIENTIVGEIKQQQNNAAKDIEKLEKRLDEKILNALDNFSLRYDQDKPLPNNLTKSAASFASEQNVIHRERELREIECILKEKKLRYF